MTAAQSQVTDIAHEADRLTPLQHGVIRYESVANPAGTQLESATEPEEGAESTPSAASIPPKLDRPFVYVPVGYIQRNSADANTGAAGGTGSACKPFVSNVLNAIGLPALPNMIITTPESRLEGGIPAVDVGMDPAISADIKANEAVLKTKIGHILETVVVDSAKTVNAWIVPESPRRWNPVAHQVLSICPASKVSTATNAASGVSKPPEVVALGLLTLMDNEAQEDQQMIKDQIEEIMVPVGSPIQRVCRLDQESDEPSADEDKMDDAPCSQLTHILFFANHHDLNLFREALMEVVPDYMVAFGSRLTLRGRDTVLRTIRNGSPLLLLKDSSQKLATAKAKKPIAATEPEVTMGSDGLDSQDPKTASGQTTAKNRKPTKAKAKVGIRYTTHRVNQLAQMIRHVKRHIRNASASASTSSSKASSGKTKSKAGTSGAPKKKSNPLRTIPPISTTLLTESALASADDLEEVPPGGGEDYQLMDSFLRTFPLEFAPDSAIVVDPLKPNTTPGQVQERLIQALVRCFGLKHAKNPDIQALQQKALDYAWSFHHIMEQYTHKKKGSTEDLHLQLIIFTLASIIASVLYNQYVVGGDNQAATDGSEQMKQHTQTAGYMATILLPLYVTSVKQESDKGTSMRQWQALTIAKSHLESEIFLFRCQVGKYRRPDKRDATIQRCIQLFTKKIQTIWKAVQPYLEDDGMEMLHLNIEKAADEIIDDETAPATTDKLGTKMRELEEREATIVSRAADVASKAKTEARASAAQSPADLLGSAEQAGTALPDEANNAEAAVSEITPLMAGGLASRTSNALKSRASAVTGMLNKPVDMMKDIGGGIEDLLGFESDEDVENQQGGLFVGRGSGGVDDDPEIDDDDEDDDDEDGDEGAKALTGPFLDDHYSPLKVNDYLRARVKRATAAKTTSIQLMSKRNAIVSSSIKFITMLSGAAAALSMQWVVPIILGVTAALNTAQDFRKYPQRIQAGNDLIVQLHKQRLFWMGLSEFQRQLPHNKDHLVLSAEDIIIMELESTHGGSAQAAATDMDEEE